MNIQPLKYNKLFCDLTNNYNNYFTYYYYFSYYYFNLLKK